MARPHAALALLLAPVALASCQETASPPAATVEDATLDANDATDATDATGDTDDLDAPDAVVDAPWDAPVGAEHTALVLTTGGDVQEIVTRLFRVDLDTFATVHLADVPNPESYAWARAVTTDGASRAFVSVGDEILAYGVDDGRVLARWSTGAGTAPGEARLCGGVLWVALAHGSLLPAFDPTTGARVDAIDLATWLTSPTSADAGALAVAGDRLYVALRSAQPARVLAVDCSTRTVTRSWFTRGGPAVWPNHRTPSAPYVLADGSLYRIDPEGGVVGPLLAPAALSVNGFDRIATSPGIEAIVGGSAGGGQSTYIDTMLACVDTASWSWRLAPEPTWWLSGDIVFTLLASGPSGLALVAAGPQMKGTGPHGLVIYDAASCAARNPDATQWILSGSRHFLAATLR